MKIFITTLVIFFSFGFILEGKTADIDYSKCAKAFNNPDIPFEILPNGKLKVSIHPTISLHEKDAAITLYGDGHLNIADHKPNPNDHYTTYVWKTKYITETIGDNLISHKIAKDSNSNIRIIEAEGVGDYQFEVRNGQCVMVRVRTDSTYGGASATVDLCKDIHDFFNQHPEFSNCFNPRMNQKMKAILEEHIKPFNYYSSQTYHTRGSMGDVARAGRITIVRSGQSPIISAHIFSQRCHDLKLSYFLNDPSLWDKENSSASGKQNNSNGVITSE